MSRYRVRCYRGGKAEEEEGEDNESRAREYLVAAPSARGGPTIAKSGGDRGREKMGNHGCPHIAGGGCLSV